MNIGVAVGRAPDSASLLRDYAAWQIVEGDEPLPVQIAGYIRHQIIHDILKPAEPIRERVIAEQLNVSRTRMRDALKILSVTELEVIGGVAGCRMKAIS